MALLNLGLVTRCFTTLLDTRIRAFPDWPAANTLLVSAGPPDLVSANHALSFYLYHAREDAHTKSQDWGVTAPDPQRYKPIGLSLYYVMTPRSNLSDANNRALADQLLMGLALKTLHDTACIDDKTTVDTGGGPVLVMPTTLRGLGNRLRITLQPTPPSEATNYWQAGTGPLRLAAYYEVSATLLEPDVPRSRSGRVLYAGVYALARGAPTIEAIENTIEYTLPGAATTQRIGLSPASVTYGEVLRVKGGDLKGDVTDLVLAHPDFADAIAVDGPWKLKTDGQELTVQVKSAIGAQAILPGIYGAFVRTRLRAVRPDGSQRDFDTWSNQLRFAIAPNVLSVTGAGPVMTIKVDGFEANGLKGDDLMVFAGSERLTRSTTSPPAIGEFFTPNTPPAARQTIRFRYPASIATGETVPLRVIVRGAESPPRWEVAP